MIVYDAFTGISSQKNNSLLPIGRYSIRKEIDWKTTTMNKFIITREKIIRKKTGEKTRLTARVRPTNTSSGCPQKEYS